MGCALAVIVIAASPGMACSVDRTPTRLVDDVRLRLV
jgi:hypothetical protein